MSKERIAVYAASLDPITYGHMDVIQRVAKLFDKIIVFIAINNAKKPRFNTEERKSMAIESLKNFSNVEVVISEGEYAVKHAKRLGAIAIVRGIRSFKDMEEEQIIAIENKKICPEIETVFIPCDPKLGHISSSMVMSHVGVDPDWEESVSRSVHPYVLEKIKFNYLHACARKHWDLFMYMIGQKSDEVFQEILKNYSQPNRFHHDLEHIVSMLDIIHLIAFPYLAELTPTARKALVWAIWTHDIVYDTMLKVNKKSKSNEQRSIELMAVLSKRLNLNQAIIDQATMYIKATEHKLKLSNIGSQYIADVDLLILGQSHNRYKKYEQAIRKEYAWVPLKTYTQKRIEILQRFLDREHIYYTEYFREEYEKIARKNLQWSIKHLQALQE